MSTAGLVDFCLARDHPEFGDTRRAVYMYIELALVLCAVVLAQYLRSYGHGYSYMLLLAICSFVLKMAPHALGTYVKGTSYTPVWGANTLMDPQYPSATLDVTLPTSTLHVIMVQWIGALSTGVVAQACGTFVWFEHLLVRWFDGKKKRLALPLIAACVGVFSALACGTDAINVLYLIPIINASKVIGMRPSKPLSALIISGMIGAACSPINPALQYYFVRYIDMVTPNGTGGFDYATTSLITYDNASVVAIPAAVCGALVAGFVAIFIGRDLETSKTYKHRLENGLVSQPGEAENAFYKRLETHAGEGSDSGSEVNLAQTKLEKEYSMQSRLEEGDYVYTQARYRDGSYVDINDRLGAAHNSAGRKSVTINVKEPDQASGSRTQGTQQTMKSQKLRQPKTKSAVSVVLLLLTGVGVLVWGVLKGIQKDDETSESIQYIVPRDWPLPTAYHFAICFMAMCTFIVLLNDLKSWQLNQGNFIKYALPGMIGTVCFSALGGSWLQEWNMQLSCLAYNSEASVKHAFTWIFWVFITSIFSGNESITQYRLSQHISALPNAFDRVRWIAAAYPMAAGAFVLPTNGNMIAAAEMDDTGSTRLGYFLVDHVFILPGIAGVAAAFGVAYGIAVGLFP